MRSDFNFLLRYDPVSFWVLDEKRRLSRLSSPPPAQTRRSPPILFSVIAFPSPILGWFRGPCLQLLKGLTCPFLYRPFLMDTQFRQHKRASTPAFFSRLNQHLTPFRLRCPPGPLCLRFASLHRSSVIPTSSIGSAQTMCLPTPVFCSR